MADHPPTPIQPIPQALRDLIDVNVEYRVLLCLGHGCQKAVRPASFLRHVRDKGHPITKEARKQAQKYVASFPNDYDHSTVPLPKDGLAPQPIIPVVDGCQCRKCAFRSQSRKAMKVHGNKEHLLKRVDDDELFQAVRLQTWFREGKERYWIVDESKQVEEERRARRAIVRDAGEESDESEAADDDHPDDNDDSQGAMDQIEREIAEFEAEKRERRLQALKDVPAAEIDPWHRYTDWHAELSKSKHNIIKTFHYTREPDADDRDDESKLGRVLRAWSRIFNRCLDTLGATNQKDALKWWASPKNEAADQRPFELPQNAKSLTKYSTYYECMWCYIMRTAPSEHWEDETETGVKYTENQWKAIQRIRKDLNSAENAADESTQPKDQDPDVTNGLMCLCMLIVMQDTSRISLYESPMMHYLAVRGVDVQSKSLRPAFNYTPILAGMLWINRLIMLEVAVPLEAWPALGLQSKADVDSVPDRIHELRRRHLCEGSFSPTASILSQLAMGKSYNKTHRSPA